jgi:hypothetical protein
MAEYLDVGDPMEVGVRVFDRLSAGQQAALIHKVGPAALRSDLPSPELTAPIEATFVAIFVNFGMFIESEVTDRPSETLCRRLALRALKEHGLRIVGGACCTDDDQWRDQLRELAHSYMWDTDYDMEDAVVDLPPDESRLWKAQFGVDAEYFGSTPLDYSDQEVELAKKEIVDLCRRG